MSIRAITWAFDQQCGSPTAKLILIKLADNANDEGVCWPSIAYMEQHCELSRTAVKENIDKLASLGLIEVTHRYRNGLKTTSSYQLRIPNNIRRSPSDHRRSPGDPTVGRQVTIEPSVEPKITPTAKRRETPVEQYDRWKREFEAEQARATLAAKAKDVVKH